jgi:glycosyltransferase involved in cell wall biosynthesis
MRILFCHNYYQRPGGEDQTFADQANVLEDHGHAVIRYTRHNDDLREMGSLAAAAATIWNRQSVVDIGELVRSQRIDVMHCANTFPLISPAAYQAARSAGAAVVQTLHNFRLACPKAQFVRDGKVCEDCLGKIFAWPGIKHGCYRDSRAATAVVAAMQTFHRLRGTWTNDVDMYIAATEFVRQKMSQSGLPAERIMVKPNFVAPDPGVRPGGGRYVVFAGRLSPEKGIDTLLAAWSKYRGDCVLKIIGDGPLADDVRRAAEADQRIEWLGQRPWDELLETIGNAACLVMPSVWYETFGRVIVEAFATGTPVVVSRMGAMAELVDDGESGFLFEPGNANDLIAKLNRLLDPQAPLADFRAAARSSYERRFTAEINYGMLIDVYRHALAHRHGTRYVPASIATPTASGTTPAVAAQLVEL